MDFFNEVDLEEVFFVLVEVDELSLGDMVLDFRVDAPTILRSEDVEPTPSLTFAPEDAVFRIVAELVDVVFVLVIVVVGHIAFVLVMVIVVVRVVCLPLLLVPLARRWSRLRFRVCDSACTGALIDS